MIVPWASEAPVRSYEGIVVEVAVGSFEELEVAEVVTDESRLTVPPRGGLMNPCTA